MRAKSIDLNDHFKFFGNPFLDSACAFIQRERFKGPMRLLLQGADALFNQTVPNPNMLLELSALGQRMARSSLSGKQFQQKRFRFQKAETHLCLFKDVEGLGKAGKQSWLNPYLQYEENL